MSQTDNIAEAKSLRFIKDNPAEEDAFGTHSRVAEAVAAVVRTHDDLKVIGLIGPWGSGKSTAVKFVQRALEKEKGIETKFFVYDAWLHQNDPPRRSFLENLIHFLGLEEEKEWKEKLEELNGQVDDSNATTTPTLTTAGRWILLSLFAVPLGFQFMDSSWLTTWVHVPYFEFGISVFWTGFALVMAPAIVATGIFLSWRPTANIFSKRFWNTNRPKYAKESILTLFTERAITRVNHRVTRSPDPTTIEFQKVFRELLARVNKPTLRYVLVLDNLDRLPGDAAVELWATIRSFFLGVDRSGSVKLPTVLLPIDPDAVKRMYSSHGDEASRLAQAFMDKTFDLTFRVPPPVFSDWKRYMDAQLRHVFQDQYSEERGYAVVDLYEKYLTTGLGAAPTARHINTLINAIAVLWLQWKGSVPFETLAYYSINKSTIEGAFSTFIRDNHRELEKFDSNWAAGIAAIHFGVPVSAAIQVYLENDLTSSIARGDVEEFKKHSETPGFDRVFEQVIARQNTSFEFISRAAYLLGSLNLPPASWIASSWRTLVERFSEDDGWSELPPESIEGISLMLENAATYIISKNGSKFITSASNVPTSLLAKKEDLAWWAGLSAAIFDASQRRKLNLPAMVFPGNEEAYLTEIVILSKRLDVAKWVKPKASDKLIVETLAAQFNNPPQSDLTPKFETLVSINPERAWTPVIDAAVNQIRGQSGEHPLAISSLNVLGTLLARKAPGLQERLDQLSSEGYLFEKLAQAHQARSIAPAAGYLALIVLRDPSFSSAHHGRAHPGVAIINSWGSDTGALASISGEFAVAIRTFTEGDFHKALVNAAEGNGALQPLARKVLTNEVRAGRELLLDVKDVVERLPVYLKYIEEPNQIDFATGIANAPDYLSVQSGLPFNDNLRKLLVLLLGSKIQDVRERARDELGIRLSGLSSSDWLAALETGSEPLHAARQLRHVAQNFEFGTPLYDALALGQDSLHSSDTAKNERWMELSSFLSANDRATQMRGLRDLLLRDEASASTLRILEAGSATLLDIGHFEEEADRALRYLVLPLLAISEGGDWLTRHTGAVQNWMTLAPGTTSGSVRDRIISLWKEGDEATKAQAKAWGDAWGVKNGPWKQGNEG